MPFISTICGEGLGEAPAFFFCIMRHLSLTASPNVKNAAFVLRLNPRSRLLLLF